MTEEFKFQLTQNLPQEFSIKASAPSNIALVKYWGKEDIQIPKNTSLSFTLSNCKTTTLLKLELKNKASDETQIQVFLDEEKTPSFIPKIQKFFHLIDPYCPYLKHYHASIHTSNTFPHSSGIASSASGMGALALCLVQIEKQLQPNLSLDDLRKKASFLARLGSGSAARSIDGGLVLWGKHQKIKESSDLFAIPFNDGVHPVFTDFQDTVLLIDRGQKQVSSSLGHSLMNGHPFAEARFAQAQDNITELQTYLASGNVKEFMRLVESEALTLHAMMMCSRPYFILMASQTLEVIHKIWNFRDETKIPVCFTLDAGANVHLLYPRKYKAEVQNWIDKNLKQHCQDKAYIHDEVGKGGEFLEIS
ncbi:MAG: diphosphomevalonate decarboxylase [Flavobacteriaceae bacterium]|nr:diphosphomevalonate decarboxylase [Flavobacteriaceae bacterium]